MPAYLKKSKSEILTEQLQKLQKTTSITAIGPGSVARSLAEAVSSQLGDMYDILDYNINQTVVTTATGTALDLIGSMYDVARKQISDLAAIDKKLGAFIFYLASPHTSDITIPKGTNIYTDATSFMGQRFSFSTTEAVVIPRGRTRTYASIAPNFVDSVYTVGAEKLIIHDFPNPGVTVFCTNPKPIAPQPALESDDQYRIRILKQIRVAAGSTADAVRFAALGVNGIRDAKIRQAPYGLGSFEAILTPERNGTTQDMITRATDAMNAVRPLGVRMYVKTPISLALDMTINLVAPTAVIAQSRDTLIKRADIGVRRYINSLLPGSELVYNQLIQIILDSSELVKDAIIARYAINGAEIMRRNYQPADDEQIVIGDIIVSIAQS